MAIIFWLCVLALLVVTGIIIFVRFTRQATKRTNVDSESMTGRQGFIQYATPDGRAIADFDGISWLVMGERRRDRLVTVTGASDSVLLVTPATEFPKGITTIRSCYIFRKQEPADFIGQEGVMISRATDESNGLVRIGRCIFPAYCEAGKTPFFSRVKVVGYCRKSLLVSVLA